MTRPPILFVNTMKMEEVKKQLTTPHLTIEQRNKLTATLEELRRTDHLIREREKRNSLFGIFG